jgi:glycosyltransferase involved in cell wall biosynthesis
MRKKIILAVTKSNFGGAQRYVYDLASALPTETFDVTVVFGRGDAPGVLEKKLHAAGIRTIPIDGLERDVHIARDWRAFRDLRKIFAEERPDIVHLNSSKMGALGALAARSVGIPNIIFTVHGFAFEEDRNPFQTLLIRVISWITMLCAHTTITLTAHAYERARRMLFLWSKVVLIPNGIQTPAFVSRAEARRELRAVRDIPDGVWIGSVGELHANKNYAAAIDGISEIEDAQLVILGDGEEREALRARAEEKQVADRVHLLGFIPDAARYLRAFDAFVLPSKKEGLPYVLLEAGLAYIPIVASDIPGNRDVILHNFTGLLFPPTNPHEQALALAKVTNDATFARTLSDELLKRIRKTFSRDAMLEKTMALYG